MVILKSELSSFRETAKAAFLFRGAGMKNATVKYCLIFCLASLPIAQAWANVKIEKYQYAQTRDHVDFVQRAAMLFEKEGEKSYPLFRDKEGPWFHDNRYLFVYNLDGTNVFHPVNPELEQKDLIDLRDLNNKPVIRYIIETVTKEGSASGWVHYLWLEPGAIFPLWKSSFVMKVKAPDEQEYVIGSGIYNMRMEKQFIVATVNDAVGLIREKGKEAFDLFKNRSSNFTYMDTYIFVISMDGKAVVDPAFPSQEGRDLLDLKDTRERYLVREMIEKLKTRDSAWVSYMLPRPGQVKSSRKTAYIRKVKIDGQLYIVGSAIFSADPIWLKL